MRRLVRNGLKLLPLLSKRPAAFRDHLFNLIANIFEPQGSAPSYVVQPWEQGVESLTSCLQAPLQRYLGEAGLQQAEAIVNEQIEQLPKSVPFSRKHGADFTLARMCYALVRELKPEIVVETGVAYGVTTTFILQALDINKTGTLDSIDLPASLRDDAAQFVGLFVPQSLRGRWRLHLGTSASILPALLTELRQIDFLYMTVCILIGT